jgi:hypothetical protein
MMCCRLALPGRHHSGLVCDCVTVQRCGAVVDPNMWQLGRMPVSHFTVRDAALRLRLLQRRMRWIPSWLAGVGAGEVAKPPWLRAFICCLEESPAGQGHSLDCLAGSCCMEPCGMGLLWLVPWCPADSVEQLQSAVCCPEASCAAGLPMPGGACVPALASLSHVFLHCAAVRPAVEWLQSGPVGTHCPE